MKSKLYFLFVLLFLSSCDQKKAINSNADDSRFYLGKNSGKISAKHRAKFPEWIKVGEECYGLVVYEPEKDIWIGIPTKCKIINEKKDGYKCETLEDLMLYEGLGCDKLGIKKGETWWETEGDLYKTKEEAIDTLKSRGWFLEF